MTLQPEEPLDMALEKHSEAPESFIYAQMTATSLPAVICVASNDEVWANLLAQNLTARGATTIQCDLRSLTIQITSIADGAWVVIDGGWPMVELQGAIEDLNATISQCHVRTVMVVDELVGPHPLSSFKPDRFVKRTPDMRVLVRELISIFQAPSPGEPEPASY